MGSTWCSTGSALDDLREQMKARLTAESISCQMEEAVSKVCGPTGAVWEGHDNPLPGLGHS